MTTPASGARIEILLEDLTYDEADRESRRAATYSGDDWVLYASTDYTSQTSGEDPSPQLAAQQFLSGPTAGYGYVTLSRWNNDALYERFRFVRVVRPDPDYTV